MARRRVQPWMRTWTARGALADTIFGEKIPLGPLPLTWAEPAGWRSARLNDSDHAGPCLRNLVAGFLGHVIRQRTRYVFKAHARYLNDFGLHMGGDVSAAKITP